MLEAVKEQIDRLEALTARMEAAMSYFRDREEPAEDKKAPEFMLVVETDPVVFVDKINTAFADGWTFLPNTGTACMDDGRYVREMIR